MESNENVYWLEGKTYVIGLGTKEIVKYGLNIGKWRIKEFYYFSQTNRQ